MHRPDEPTIRTALREHEMRAEHRINRIRAAAIATASVLDLTYATLARTLSSRFLVFGALALAFSAVYVAVVHRLTRGTSVPALAEVRHHHAGLRPAAGHLSRVPAHRLLRAPGRRRHRRDDRHAAAAQSPQRLPLQPLGDPLQQRGGDRDLALRRAGADRLARHRRLRPDHAIRLGPPDPVALLAPGRSVPAGAAAGAVDALPAARGGATASTPARSTSSWADASRR